MRTEYDIDERKRPFQAFRRTRLLRHAAADGDDKVLILLFQFFQRADIAFRPIFRVFADAAGVEYDHPRIFLPLCAFIAEFPHDARQFFRFVNVHLAAVGNDVIRFVLHGFSVLF